MGYLFHLAGAITFAIIFFCIILAVMSSLLCGFRGSL